MTTTELAERLKKLYPRDSKVVVYIEGVPFEVGNVIVHPKKNYTVLPIEPLKENEDEASIVTYLKKCLESIQFKESNDG